MKKSVAAASCATLLGVFAQPGFGDDRQSVRTYAARFESLSDAGRTSVPELLTLQQGATRSFVTVASADGAVVSLPTEILPDGEVASNVADPGVSCYNTAAALLAANRGATKSTGVVFVRLASRVVSIDVPLRMTSNVRGLQEYIGTGTRSIAQESAAGDKPVKVVTEAHVSATGNVLVQALVVTNSWSDTGTHFFGRITCSLARVLPGAASLN